MIDFSNLSLTKFVPAKSPAQTYYAQKTRAGMRLIMKKSRTPYLLLLILATFSITACSNSSTFPKEEPIENASEASVTKTEEANKENEVAKEPVVIEGTISTEESDTEEDTISNEETITEEEIITNEEMITEEEIITDEENNLLGIDITSSTLREDGKWLSIITNTQGNKSPQLSWTPVENAACYVILMLDTSAGNWLHWIVKDRKETELELGAKPKNSQYVGPYPPSGTHNYEISVYALSASPDSYIGTFNDANTVIDLVIKSIDTSNGKRGNIIAKGTISGTYTTDEVVE